MEDLPLLRRNTAAFPTSLWIPVVRMVLCVSAGIFMGVLGLQAADSEALFHRPFFCARSFFGKIVATNETHF